MRRVHPPRGLALRAVTLVLPLAIAALGAGCRTDDDADDAGGVDDISGSGPSSGGEDDGASGDGDGDGDGVSDDGELPAIREIKVLYTNDEHGWMEGQSPQGSAAQLVQMWRDVEGYEAGGPFVILSGGDMWTGPAISTWFQGESMVEVMNAMRYDAAAVGNHEFDFGLDALAQRASEATFPLLTANTRARATGEVPTQHGFVPYEILDVQGVKIGVVGLTTRSTPTTTVPANVADFEFIDYEQALREVVPEVRGLGAELVFVPGHVCMYELEPLAREISDLGVDLLGGGHCNELVADQVGDIVLLEGGSHFTAYAWATFSYDTESQSVLEVDYGTRINAGGLADAGIDAIVSKWADEASTELDRVIGYTDQLIEQRSEAQERLVTRPILEIFSEVDLYLTNAGGLRAPIPAGEITVGDIVSVMPFDNNLVRVELTGDEIVTVVQSGSNPVIGGGDMSGGTVVLDTTGAPVVAGQSYTVMVNSFMYQGGDNYGSLAIFDPDGFDTGINPRDPVIEWIEAQGSSPGAPLQF